MSRSDTCPWTPRLRLSLAAAVVFLALTPASASASVIVVTGTADVEADDGVCSLREAATAVNTDTATGITPGECAAGSVEDTVHFALPPASVLPVVNTPVVFTQPVSIKGPGASSLLIAAVVSRALVFDGSASTDFAFSLSGVQISYGQALTTYLGAYSGSGGGLLAVNVGVLAIWGVRFSDNFAPQGGAALYLDQPPGGIATIEDTTFEANDINSGIAGGGGAILAGLGGSLAIRRCLFADNVVANPGTASADDSQGGAIWVPPVVTGALEIESSTFSGNQASGHGGAISFGSPASPGFDPTVTTAIRNSTFTANQADTDGDATASSGGALFTTLNHGTVALYNTIVAGNVDGTPSDPAPDLVGGIGPLASGGYNLIGIRHGAGTIFPAGLPNAAGDWVGTLVAPLDPGLGALADNGGPTRSHLPVASPASPAIDHGSCSAAYEDQRLYNDGGLTRIFDEPTIVDSDDGCDIGSIEIGLQAPPDVFYTNFETGDLFAWSGSVGWAP